MSASYTLRAEVDAHAGQAFPIHNSATLGREADNAIALADVQLSRRHARFDAGPGGLAVTDLGSANGVYVNGRRIVGPTPLRPGDTVGLGGGVFRVEASGGDLDRIGGGGPPLGSPVAGYAVPPSFAPGAQPYLVPPAPPSPPPARRASLPLPLLVAVGALLLLVCAVVGGTGVFIATRGGASPTTTAALPVGVAIPAASAPAGASAPGAAGAAPAASAASNTQRQAGMVTGRVTTAIGQPITAGGAVVKIAVTGVSTAGEKVSYQPRTDAQGRYSQQVAAGTYGATATVTTTYNGKQYTISLDPADGDPTRTYDTAQGVVKDFVWKTSGLIAGRAPSTSTASNYYGLALTVEEFGYGANRIYTKYPKDSIRLTLTPRGPLIDGSTGQAVNRQIQVTDIGTYRALLIDIPLGSYTVTATLVEATGTTRPLLVGNTADSATSGSYPLDPEPYTLFFSGVYGTTVIVRE